MDLKQLADFLNEANKSTYANKDAPRAQSSRLKSEDYHFEKDGLIYHDTYFGSRDFIGEEVVYKNNEPVWAMNYYGAALNPKISTEDTYSILRPALMQDYNDIIPVRGPKKYIKDDSEYRNTPEGDLNRFTGMEEIYLKGDLVYRGWYHGGAIE